MSHKLLVLSAAIAICLSISCTGSTPPTTAEEPVVAETDRVRRLFDAMAAGEFADRAFPEIVWDDIPALLELGSSTRLLEDFPRNPLSSQFEESCAEGLVALWLLEGVRKGGGYPSLNALCFAGRVEGSDWTGASAANHEPALAAYRAWWSKVRDLPRAEAAAIDPLEGTGLHWF